MEPYQYNAQHDQETAPPIPNTIGMGMGMGMGIGGGAGGGMMMNSSKYSGVGSSSSASSSSSSSSSMVCRQSSTRWIPTSEQIRILRDLYYNCGIRSPTSEQIQRISATLRRYGKIEGKNVFYWFQNHKARERQKKRLSVDPNSAATPSHNKSLTAASAAAAISVSSPCVSPGVYGVGQILENSVYEGSMIRERSFREYCCMAGGVAVEGGGVIIGEERESNNNASWLGVDTAAADADAAADAVTTAQWMHYCPDRLAAASAAREIETLPLFPTCSGGNGGVLNGEEEEEEEEQEGEQVAYGGGANWTEYMQGSLCHNNGHGHGHGAASLELTLSSYYCSPPPGSM